MSPELAVRKGFWVAVGAGALCLAGAFVSPVVGTTMAGLFFALAWGIRRRQVWAATAVAFLLLAPVALVLAQAGRIGWALAGSLVVQVAVAWLPVRTAIALWRHREAARFGAGWLAATIVLVLGAVALHPYAMAAGSMANTLLPGDYVLSENLSWRLGRTPHVGDVVQVHYPLDRQAIFIKRVVGVPGDRLRLAGKQLYRNGAPLVEPYAVHSTCYIDPYRDDFPAAPEFRLPGPALEMLENHVINGEVVVPPGAYFVLGDNRDDSLDSRYWGFVSRADIAGSPLLIYASYNLQPGAQAIAGTVFNTRWNRLLKLL
jgi:signal peptidase I